MRIAQRLIAVFLTVLMILPFAVACGKEPPENPDGTSSSGGGSTTETGGTSDGEKDNSLKMDLGGYHYKAYVRSDKTGNAQYYCEDFYTETAKEDSISFAVADRNAKIVEDYNCVISQVLSSTDQEQEMIAFYQGGVKFELAILQTMAAAPLATRNILRDLKTQDNLHLDAEYYDQNCISQFSIYDKLYFISGDMNISTMDTAVATIFNETLYEQRYPGKESPYEMVKNGTWTQEAMMTMAKESTVLISGGQTPDATKGDTVGYFKYDQSGLYYYYGSGNRITTKNRNDVPEFTITAGNSADVARWLFENMTQLNNKQIMNGLNAVRLENFLTGDVLFTDVRLNNVRRDYYYNSDKAKYGILPIPKFTEEQTGYYSVIYFHDYVHLWTMPQQINDAEKAAILMDAFAEYSAEEDGVMDAYFRRTMELNAAPNSESRDMLKMIRNSLVYDVYLLYHWGTLDSYFTKIYTATANTFSSTTSPASLLSAETEMERQLTKFRNPSFSAS